MSDGQAYAIFKQIDSDKFTVNEKGFAIHKVLSMATHNSVTKKDFMAALEWLWHEHFEFTQETEGE